MRDIEVHGIKDRDRQSFFPEEEQDANPPAFKFRDGQEANTSQNRSMPAIHVESIQRQLQTTSAKPDLLDFMTVSDMCVDLTVTGNVHPQFCQVEQIVGDYSLELGGSANIFATQLVKLGACGGVIGYVGEDMFGEFALRELQSSGVNVTRVKKHSRLKTGIGIALVEKEDRAILTWLGTIDATRGEDLEESIFRSCRHWHIASYFLLTTLRPFWSYWIQRCKKEGLSISLDTNWDPANRWEGVLELLPYIDVFLPNESEALALTGETDVWKAARLLSASGPLTVVKLGAKGAIAVKSDKSWQIEPSGHDSPMSIVDSIGAGDNFDAGFIRAWQLGHDIDSSLLLGHRCAVSSLSRAGGIRGQLVEEINLRKAKVDEERQ